jgi:hypothetical protein
MRLPDEVSGVERAAAGGTPTSLDLASDEFVEPEERRKNLRIERGNISHWPPVIYVETGFASSRGTPQSGGAFSLCPQIIPAACLGIWIRKGDGSHNPPSSRPTNASETQHDGGC